MKKELARGGGGGGWGKEKKRGLVSKQVQDNKCSVRARRGTRRIKGWGREKGGAWPFVCVCVQGRILGGGEAAVRHRF